MDSLPLELLTQVLEYLSPDELRPGRLVCHTFSRILFPRTFAHIPKWLDYEASHRAVISLAQDVCNRPAVMWSPWALVPDKAVDPVFLNIVWKMIVEEEKEEEEEGGVRREEELTAMNFAELSGRQGMSEARLRTAQNRYLLHRAYAGGFDFCGDEKAEKKEGVFEEDFVEW